MCALGAGTTTDKVFDMVADLRKTVDTPFVFMTYANVVFHYGIEKFCVRAAEAGVDGLILPDVPFEEKEEFASPCRKHGMDLISMIAPTSEERIDTIAREAEGFIYCVSSLGVTGTRSSITTDLDSIVARIRAVTDTPIAICPQDGGGYSRIVADHSANAKSVQTDPKLGLQVRFYWERSGRYGAPLAGDCHCQNA